MTPGEIAYKAFVQAMGWGAIEEARQRLWDTLPDKQKAAWEAAAKAVGDGERAWADQGTGEIDDMV